MSRTAYAHSANPDGEWQPLLDHLEAVALLATAFAEPFGGAHLARWAGLWHDLGKLHPDFQRYLADPSRERGPDHSSAGAVHAAELSSVLPFLIAGHHGGLPNREDLKIRLEKKRSSGAVREAISTALEELPHPEPGALGETALPPWLRGQTLGREDQARLGRSLELFIRLLFSALVDADFLDTEAHLSPDRAAGRQPGPTLQELWQRFEAHHRHLAAGATTDLHHLRNEIYDHCLAAGPAPAGLFRLSVPTGGGKTLSGMGFALAHALHHGFRRVIVAIPYTSIIEQNADTYRKVFGDGVLEHHSAVTPREPTDPVTAEDLWARLASENWDAPVVVTTTVRLFESLFANRPSATRKLHNLAESVLILDEVQTLPPRLLEPILDVLAELARHYRVSIVFSTATQPALLEGPYAPFLAGAREIVADPERYFSALRRVRYELPAAAEAWSWERVAQEMRLSSQALAVVNTKADAFHLLDALDDPGALHLSTTLCGAHRRDALATIRERLERGEPCRVVSTQVVEAGVDLDFPLVLRAVGPLDRIVQAAGRANREGRLGPEGGRVVVFEPEDGSTPPGDYATGLATARTLLATGADLHDPATHRAYFERLYQAVPLDGREVQDRRAHLDFPETAHRFRMIEDDGVPVVVVYRRKEAEVRGLVEAVRHGKLPPQAGLRKLQPYIVNLRRRQAEALHRDGALEPLQPGLFVWHGRYDEVRGLVSEAVRDPAELVV